MGENKYRDIAVNVVANGFVVTIGCTTVVARTPEEMITLATQYFTDPLTTEKKIVSADLRFNRPPMALDERAGNDLRTAATSRPIEELEAAISRNRL